ncbi:MAG: hypothetical protein QCI00_05955, partial [Candidatus Thermoplasmatota archaeon]|nr:hypothetical protein [Candidatus Thermoplasmatota archaeon]
MWKKISVFALVVFLTSVFSIVQPAEIERGYNEESEKNQYVTQPFSNSSSYEEWNVTLGGGYIDIGYDIQQTSDGGYIIVGYTRSYGDTSGRNIWLVKTDGSGIEEWNKTFGGNDDDEGHSVRQTTDGGYILTGHTESFGSNMNDVILIKTDASGNEEWMKIFGGEYDDEGYSVRQTTDGGYIIAGVTTSFATGGRDAWLIKTNASGNEEWSETYGGLSSDGARSVQQTSDGGYIMTGWTASYSAGYLFDIWLVKTDGYGNEEWNNTWGGTGVEADVGYSVKQTADGGYILTGETQSFGGDNYDAILIKTDVFGDEEWMKTFVGTFREYGRDVQQTTDGGYIVVGYTVTYGAGSD